MPVERRDPTADNRSSRWKAEVTDNVIWFAARPATSDLRQGEGRTVLALLGPLGPHLQPGNACGRLSIGKRNNGAPGSDGVTFAAIEEGGVDVFLEQLRTELVSRSYRPQRVRHVAIPKGGGQLRRLSIPTIRDRVVQGAVKLILEPIFEADFQPGSYGYRPEAQGPCGGRPGRHGDCLAQDACRGPGPTGLLRYGAA